LEGSEPTVPAEILRERNYDLDQIESFNGSVVCFCGMESDRHRPIWP
jgi:hypothetical protein